MRARIGYLPENHRYPAHLTGASCSISSAHVRLLRAGSCAVEGLLRRVRMEDWRSTPVRKYSKGMMQRLGLAQAILNDPDLLILDEPTDGVDPVGRREIRDLLLEQKARGATIFLNSHLLSEVERLCDRVAILKSGKLIREGGVEELTRPRSAWEIDLRATNAAAVAAIVATTPGLRPMPPSAGVATGSATLEFEGAPGMHERPSTPRAGGVLRSTGCAAAAEPRRSS